MIRLIYPLSKFDSKRYLITSQWHQIITKCQQRGLILFSGPIGSGKTTSMYELLRVFADCQIMCIEDPIEIYQSDFLQL